MQKKILLLSPESKKDTNEIVPFLETVKTTALMSSTQIYLHKSEIFFKTVLYENKYIATCYGSLSTLTCSTSKNTVRKTQDLSFILCDRQPAGNNTEHIFVVHHFSHSPIHVQFIFKVQVILPSKNKVVKQFSEIKSLLLYYVFSTYVFYAF